MSVRVTVDDWELAARERLTPMAYDYFRSGADEEHTLRRNRDAYARWVLWYRTLVDVAAPELETTVLGSKVRSPILVAPTAYHRMAHEGGELASAAGTADAGSLFVASTLATTSLENVAAASSAPKWFQLYVHRDRAFTERLVARAQAAGYRAIVVTADTPLLGRRVADVKNGFCLPDGMRMENLVETGRTSAEGEGAGSELARYVASRHDASFSFRDLEWLVRLASPLPVVVKGIVRDDDAVRAKDAGASAIWVSNHGGRQLDYAPATIDALPGVRAAVGNAFPVYVDGGIRSGTQTLIALACGADAVFVGRPVLWGLATAGREGVCTVLELLSAELARAMALAGVARLSDARADLVRRTLV